MPSAAKRKKNAAKSTRREKDAKSVPGGKTKD
jgi:hypothetical protein